MTAREKKAVEIMRKSMPTVEGINMYHGIPDEKFMNRPLSMGMAMILEGMEWQAEQCEKVARITITGDMNRSRMVINRKDILNAGTEEVA